MSDSNAENTSPLAPHPRELFNTVQRGQYVVVREQSPIGEREFSNWWMGLVIWREEGMEPSTARRLLRVVDVDDGTVRFVRAHQVTHILHGLDGLDAA